MVLNLERCDNIIIKILTKVLFITWLLIEKEDISDISIHKIIHFRAFSSKTFNRCHA